MRVEHSPVYSVRNMVVACRWKSEVLEDHWVAVEQAKLTAEPMGKHRGLLLSHLCQAPALASNWRSSQDRPQYVSHDFPL